MALALTQPSLDQAWFPKDKCARPFLGVHGITCMIHSCKMGTWGDFTRHPTYNISRITLVPSLSLRPVEARRNEQVIRVGKQLILSH